MRRRFRSRAQMGVWAREILRGPAHVAPRAPTPEAVDRVVDAIWEAGVAHGRATIAERVRHLLGLEEDDELT